MNEHRTPNRLIEETSPYLLQHAYNPVDWYPWGEAALAASRRDGKPILLSVGYAACHWCHVMERESFEDPDTAALMNEHFVSVKVDREERPDIDGIYMNAVQAMTGQGGWPMTVFLTPDGEPFFAGTYFPDSDRHGMPSFRKVLTAVAEAWRDRRDDVVTQGRNVVDHIRQAGRVAASDEPLTDTILEHAYETLRSGFDAAAGGFGTAPKFPQPMTLEFLLRCHARGMPEALPMVTLTLHRMLEGGIHDQIGGGFHRYSTDHRWLVPHFEKMLYDNAQLLRLYTRAWQVTGTAAFRQTAERTAAYMLRELRHPDGGFFSSQDADSEGEEGRFFVWSYDELVEVAGTAMADWFGALPEGNWEGKNILWVPRPLETAAAEAGRRPEETTEELERVRQDIERAREQLFERRSTRVAPATDDKVLTAWNGLAISALAEAGRVLGQQHLLDAAVQAAEFLLANLLTPTGRLLRAWRDGRTGGPAYLDDYALLAEACLTLYETTYEPRWLVEATHLADELVRLFHDPDGGGFYQTGGDAEELVLRPRELFDNAVPAGGSVAADVLQRLAALTGDREREELGVSALRSVADLLARAPTGFGYALGALDLYLGQLKEIAIVGDADAEDTRSLVGEVWSRYLPNRVLAVGRPGDAEAVAAAPLLRDRPTVDGHAAAYVCENFVCQRPVTDPAALADQLTTTS